MSWMHSFLKVYRIQDWLHYLGFVILGSVITGNFSPILFLQASIMLAYAYSLNDYFDGESDKKWFFAPLILGLPPLILLTPLQLASYFAFMAVFTLYSWPKTYLEGRPMVSTLSNSFGFLFIFLLPFTGLGQIYSFGYFVLLIFLLNTAAQLIHEIAHEKEDGKKGKITTAVCLGRKSLWLLRTVFASVAIVSLTFIPDRILVFVPTILYSLYFLYTSEGTIDGEYRNRFKLVGIVCGVFYLLEFLSLQI